MPRKKRVPGPKTLKTTDTTNASKFHNTAACSRMQLHLHQMSDINRQPTMNSYMLLSHCRIIDKITFFAMEYSAADISNSFPFSALKGIRPVKTGCWFVSGDI